MRGIISSFRSVLLSNGISALISILTILVVPKIIGVEAYGYWQYYVFIISYSLFTQIGLSDGVFLRFGGSRKEDLEDIDIRAHLTVLVLQQVTIFLISLIVLLCLNLDFTWGFLYSAIAITVPILNIRQLFLAVNEAIGRFNVYSRLIIEERLLCVSLFSLILIFGITDFRFFVACEVVSRSFSLFRAWLSVQGLFNKLHLNGWDITKKSWDEVCKSVSAGVKVTFGYAATMLIMGLCRYTAKAIWGIAIFGSMSLSLNVLSFFAIVVNAAGPVLFPAFRKLSKEKAAEMYERARVVVAMLSQIIMVAVIPMIGLLKLWLPDYTTAIDFMYILTLVLLFQSRVDVLSSPYLQANRKESIILQVNLATCGFSALGCLLIWIFELPIVTLIYLLVGLFGFRSYVFDYKIYRIFDVGNLKYLVLDILVISNHVMRTLIPDLTISVILTLLVTCAISVFSLDDLKYIAHVARAGKDDNRGKDVE